MKFSKGGVIPGARESSEKFILFFSYYMFVKPA